MYMDYFELEEKFYEADKMINDGRISDAAHLLEAILIEAPDFGKAHNHMGWLYETKFKNFTKAEEHYKFALKFSPEYPAAYYNYAYLLSTLRRYPELETLLNDAINVPGISYSTIYNEFALLHEALGHYTEAIHYFKLYIQNVFEIKSIDTATDSIKRCEKKMQIFA